MALALSSSGGLFMHMQENLLHVNDKRVTLTRGVHAALSDFRWLADDLEKLPTASTS